MYFCLFQPLLARLNMEISSSSLEFSLVVLLYCYPNIDWGCLESQLCSYLFFMKGPSLKQKMVLHNITEAGLLDPLLGSLSGLETSVSVRREKAQKGPCTTIVYPNTVTFVLLIIIKEYCTFHTIVSIIWNNFSRNCHLKKRWVGKGIGQVRHYEQKW